MKFIYGLLLVICTQTILAEGCTVHGQLLTEEGWSKNLHFVCLLDPIKFNNFTSPDGKKLLIANERGFALKVDGKMIAWPEGRELDPISSSVFWSPSSSAFFINFANGSGMSSKLIAFVLSGDHLIPHKEIDREIVDRFRGALKCSARDADPNTWGMGWADDGGSILGFAQATVNEPCGQQGDFRGFIFNLSEDSIQAFYSEKEVKRIFYRILPRNMR